MTPFKPTLRRASAATAGAIMGLTLLSPFSAACSKGDPSASLQQQWTEAEARVEKIKNSQIGQWASQYGDFTAKGILRCGNGGMRKPDYRLSEQFKPRANAIFCAAAAARGNVTGTEAEARDLVQQHIVRAHGEQKCAAQP